MAPLISIIFSVFQLNRNSELNIKGIYGNKEPLWLHYLALYFQFFNLIGNKIDSQKGHFQRDLLRNTLTSWGVFFFFFFLVLSLAWASHRLPIISSHLRIVFALLRHSLHLKRY